MQYASSLLYGGMLVDAEKADYKDYARLLLRCPFCGEAVFLVAGKHRDEHARLSPKSKQIVLVKASSVSPAFAHFPGVANQNCELRSAKINSSFVARCVTKSRNQRLKIFQNHIGKAFKPKNVDFEKLNIQNALRRANSILATEYVHFLEEMEKDTRKDFEKRILVEENRKEFKSVAKQICEAAIENPLKAVELNNDVSSAKNWLESLEVDLHLEIIYEIIDFLITKSAKPFRDKLFDIAFVRWADCYISNNSEREFYKLFDLTHCKNIQALKKNYNSIVDGILIGAIAFLCGVGWADFIEENQEGVTK
jgi:hypothetical protein